MTPQVKELNEHNVFNNDIRYCICKTDNTTDTDSPMLYLTRKQSCYDFWWSNDKNIAYTTDNYLEANLLCEAITKGYISIL